MLKQRRTERLLGRSISLLMIAVGGYGLFINPTTASSGMMSIMLMLGIFGLVLSTFATFTALRFSCLRCSQPFTSRVAIAAMQSDVCPHCGQLPWLPTPMEPRVLMLAQEADDPQASKDQSWMRESEDLLEAVPQGAPPDERNPYASARPSGAVFRSSNTAKTDDATASSVGGHLRSLWFELTASKQQLDDAGYLPKEPKHLSNLEAFRDAAVRAVHRNGMTRLIRLIVPIVLTAIIVSGFPRLMTNQQGDGPVWDFANPTAYLILIPMGVAALVVWMISVSVVSMFSSLGGLLLGRFYRQWLWGNPPPWPAVEEPEHHFFGIAIPLNVLAHPFVRVRVRSSSPQLLTITLVDQYDHAVATIERQLSTPDRWTIVAIDFLLIASGRPGGCEVRIESKEKLFFEVDDVELVETRTLLASTT